MIRRSRPPPGRDRRERTNSTMARPQRREFLGLALGGRACGRRRSASVRPAAAEPLGLSGSVHRRHRPEGRGSAGRPAVQGAERAASRRLFRAQFRAIRLDPPRPGNRDLGRREARLFPRAAASRLRLHDAGRDQHRRERPVAAGHLRPGRLRLRQTAAAGRDGRSRIFRPAHPPGVGRRFSGRRDLPGRELLPLTRAGPEFRRDGARAGDPHRRRTRRGVSAVSRVLGREADPGVEHADDVRAPRLGKRDRRIPLHHPAARDDDHRHRDDADRPGADRQARHRRHGGQLPLQPPRSPAPGRLASGGL